MPGFDGTGPQSQGPKTGRKLGRCKSATAGAVTRSRGTFGPGLGRRVGFGRGLGRFFAQNASQAPVVDKQSAEFYRDALQKELTAVEEYLAKQ